MPSKSDGLVPATSGIRSNAAPADVRVMSVASFDVNPISCALTG